MDPITHAIAGLVIGSKAGAGLSISNGLVIASTLGAVAPDFDIITRLWGDYVYLGQHRKFSHSLPGILTISLLIGVILTPLYQMDGFFSLCCWALLGGLSHSFLDMFNSYGVSIFWPIKREKLSFNLMPIFDPILFLILIGFIFAKDKLIINTALTAVIVSYVFFLTLMRHGAYRLVKKKLKKEYPDSKLVVLPLRFPVWDFIARLPEHNVIGTVNNLKKEVRIIKSFMNVKQHLRQVVQETVLGKYFRDFTPFYHIHSETVEDKHVVQLMDLRYRVGGRFLHNATLIMDKEFNIEEAVFQPFCLTRKIYVN